MKKRILLLVPCLLLLLGLLTACGGTESSEAVEDKLVNATWTTQVEDSDDFKGFIDIDMPFGLGNLVTLKFNSDKTGYIQIGETGLIKFNFDWVVSGRQINLKFDSAIGDHSSNLTFQLDDTSLRLKGKNININLNRG